MRKNLLLLIVALASYVVFGQQGVKLIEKFDTVPNDSTFQIIGEGSQSSMIFITSTTDKKEGTASCSVKAKIGAYHGWGSYVQLLKRKTDSMPFEDWSASDSLSIWIKVVNAPTIPANMVFRIHIADRPNPTDAIEEYVYEHATILDDAHDWINLKIALKSRYTDGTVNPNDSGFVRTPDSWNGGSNNKKLDWDKIVGWNIGLITAGWNPNGNLPADSLTILLDGFQRYGLKAVPAIIFNGMAVSPNLSQFTWGQSSLALVVGAGNVPGANALKWTQGNEWNNGWTGVGYNVNPSFNLGGAWQTDSIKFKMKCDVGVDTLRVQFESGAGKVGQKFKPIANGTWNSYSLALKKFVPQDNTTGFDSTNVTVFQIMAEATAIAGKVIWMTDIWTGNPVIVPVPVELNAFTSSVNGNAVNLSWSTATEKNNRGFEIERKSVNSEWENIAFVSGKGTSTEVNNYTYTDKNVNAGKYDYRLIQKDFDGTSEIFNLSQSVEVGSPLGYSLEQNYPNPFNPSTMIKYSIPENGIVKLFIYNSIGEKVASLVNQQMEAGDYEVNFNASNLASGIYFYKLESGNFTAVKKLMLIK